MEKNLLKSFNKNMTHPIIKTENYLLVVDNESEIKEKEWCYIPFEGGSIKRKGRYFADDWKKITFHLPLNNAPILEGVPLLPPIEDESNFFAEQETIKNEWNSEKSFKAGYNKAKEKYKFTKEDLRKSVAYAIIHKHIKGDILINKIIKSLQQPKYPVAFECEMECGRCYKPLEEKDDCWSAKECCQGSNSYPDLLKTITNSQGLTQLVGKYIY
jgi:hypothetical protein